jgi:hypothetical protein
MPVRQPYPDRSPFVIPLVAGRAAARRAPLARSRTSRGLLFHAPSFSIGLVLGAAIVLTTAYLPEFLGRESAPGAGSGTPGAQSPSPPVTFEFDTLLRDTQPPMVTQSRPRQPAAPTDDGTTEYLLQAASFRSRDDADRLRAELLLLDLPAQTSAVTVGSSVWYRVTVGPFSDQRSAQQAMTQLRERNLAAMLVKRKRPT